MTAWIDAFADRVNAQGYAPHTAYRKILLASCFSQWLKQEAIALADITPDHPARYLWHRWQRLRLRESPPLLFGDGPGQVRIAHHVRDLQVLDGDPVPALHDRCRNPVERVALPYPCPLPLALNGLHILPAGRRTHPRPRHGALRPPERTAVDVDGGHRPTSFENMSKTNAPQGSAKSPAPCIHALKDRVFRRI